MLFLEYDGVFLSNGPGDPTMNKPTIETVRKLVTREDYKPVFGICLGHQILSLAIGASTFKMKWDFFSIFCFVLYFKIVALLGCLWKKWTNGFMRAYVMIILWWIIFCLLHLINYSMWGEARLKRVTYVSYIDKTLSKDHLVFLLT